MIYVYVFDYCSASIYEFTCKIGDDIEEAITKKGFKLSCCYYMTTNDKKQIINIDEK